MRLLGAAIACVCALTLAACATAPEPPVERYSIASTAIGVLLEDPAARAVLDRYVPTLSGASQVEAIRNAPLRAIQGYAPTVLTDAVMAQIDAELSQLTPIARTGAPEIRVVNTDEARVGEYTLPDVLRMQNGRRVRTAEAWWNERRPEVLSLYETNVYGRAPGRPADMTFNVFDAGTPALGGRATRKQIDIRLSSRANAPTIQLVEYLPVQATGRVPMLVMIHFEPISNAMADPGVRRGFGWDQATGQRVPASGNAAMGRLDETVTRFVDAGFGVAVFYYGDIEPDYAGGYPYGIRGLLDGASEATRAPDSWGTIAAWAWGLSRVQDYLETDPAVDAQRVAIFGASRLGKTVLWAAANDQRFAAVVACCSGEMGAALMRRDFGEFIGESSQYWTARNLAQYYDDVDALPVDAHMLLALIAPRPVLLQTGDSDYSADPKGEFLAAVAAGPVYRLLGGEDLGTTQWPPSGPILNDQGYFMHEGGHGMVAADWDVYLQFLQRHLQPAR